MKKRQFTAFALPALYGMLILAMLILTAAAARCYTRVLERRDENTRQRSALSFIQTQAAASGGTGTVVLRDGPEGVAVCFGEPDHAYETRVYLYNGSLCTEFSRADQPINALNADPFCRAGIFSAEWERGELLSITADGWHADVWCPGGSADE